MASTLKGNQNAFLSFLGWFLSNKSEYVFEREPWQKQVFANYISESSFIENFNEYKNSKSIELIEFKIEDYEKKDPKYLYPIVRLTDYVNQNLKEFLKDFLIHGSISTLDYSKGWSDLDTLLIIKKEILRDPNKLINLRRHILNMIPELYAIDPLQHHEFIITTENALLHPSYSLLPSEALNFSKSLFGNKSLKISRNRENKNSKKTILSINNLFKKAFEVGYMDHHKQNNIALEDNFNNRNCMYQLKYFLSCIMTLPTYYLDSIGNSCYKKFSFENFYERSSIDLEILKKSSRIRELWPNMEQFPYEGNKIPEWICETLGNNYFERAYYFSSEIAKLTMNIKETENTN